MKVGILTNLSGERVGLITEADDGTVTGTDVGERLVQQAPGKSFDDWLTTIHHSTYLRFSEGSEADITN
jgi:hypothetical protein